MAVVFEGVGETRCKGRLLLLDTTLKGYDDLQGIASPKNYDIDVIGIDAIVVDATAIR